MKYLFTIVLSALLSAVISYTCSFAQSSSTRVVRHIGNAGSLEGEPFSFGELGAMILKDSTGLNVALVADPAARPRPYKFVDLRQGDFILMMNGAKVTSTAELQKAYDSLGIGGQVKLGVKRDGQLMVVSFAKADPATLPKRKVMIMNGEPGKSDQNVTTNVQRVKIAPGVKDVEPVPGLGLVLGIKDSKVVVAAVMPMAQERPELKSVSAGDEVTLASGKKITSTKDFVTAYEAVKIGDPFKFTVLRGGKESEISLAKQEDNNVQIIQKK